LEILLKGGIKKTEKPNQSQITFFNIFKQFNTQRGRTMKNIYDINKNVMHKSIIFNLKLGDFKH